jgi:hypothetical protein
VLDAKAIVRILAGNPGGASKDSPASGITELRTPKHPWIAPEKPEERTPTRDDPPQLILFTAPSLPLPYDRSYQHTQGGNMCQAGQLSRDTRSSQPPHNLTL